MPHNAEGRHVSGDTLGAAHAPLWRVHERSPWAQSRPLTESLSLKTAVTRCLPIRNWSKQSRQLFDRRRLDVYGHIITIGLFIDLIVGPFL